MGDGPMSAQGPQGRPYQRKWVRIVDPKYQLHTLRVACAAIPLSLALAWVVFSSAQEVLAAGPREEMLKAVSRLYATSAAFIAGTGILICLYAIVHSHRMAGPAYRLTRVARQMSDGRLDEPVRVRENDYLIDLASAMEGMRQRMLEERKSRRDAAMRLREVAVHLSGPDRAALEGAASSLEGVPEGGAA